MGINGAGANPIDASSFPADGIPTSSAEDLKRSELKALSPEEMEKLLEAPSDMDKFLNNCEQVVDDAAILLSRVLPSTASIGGVGLGAAIGTCVAPGVGTFFGAAIGGYAGSKLGGGLRDISSAALMDVAKKHDMNTEEMEEVKKVGDRINTVITVVGIATSLGALSVDAETVESLVEGVAEVSSSEDLAGHSLSYLSLDSVVDTVQQSPVGEFLGEAVGKVLDFFSW